jgi:hypothetical protein
MFLISKQVLLRRPSILFTFATIFWIWGPILGHSTQECLDLFLLYKLIVHFRTSGKGIQTACAFLLLSILCIFQCWISFVSQCSTFPALLVVFVSVVLQRLAIAYWCNLSVKFGVIRIQCWVCTVRNIIWKIVNKWEKATVQECYLEVHLTSLETMLR